MKQFLIIDDEASIRENLQMYLEEEGFDVQTAEDGPTGIDAIETYMPDFVLLDIRLPGLSGLEVLKLIQKLSNDIIVIMITGSTDMSTTIDAMKLGAYEFIHKPIDIDELDATIKKAINMQKMKDRLENLTHEIQQDANIENMIGKHPKMIEIFKTIGRIANTRVPVLVRGESGTGKELIARAIHFNSTPNEPFVPVNCSSIVETLLESELFGHEKGAFTGATSKKRGKFELANHGSLFLDEIGDMPLNLQAKLLRVVQFGKFERVGSEKSQKSDIRIIAATNQPIEKHFQSGKFRKDLFFRLNVVTIEIPPLRERKNDIPELTGHFLKKICIQLHKPLCRLTPSAIEYLQNYHWPGNVRELENSLTRAVLLSSSHILTENDLSILTVNTDSYNSETLPSIISLEEAEKLHIKKILQHTKGNKNKACKILKISFTTLDRKIKKYNLQFSK